MGIDALFTPLLLVFGLNPRSAAATGMFLTGIYALGVLVVSVIQSNIDWQYAGFIAACTFVLTLVYTMIK